MQLTSPTATVLVSSLPVAVSGPHCSWRTLNLMFPVSKLVDALPRVGRDSLQLSLWGYDHVEGDSDLA